LTLWGAPRLNISLGFSRKWAAARFFLCVGQCEESVMRKIEIILNEMEEFPEPLLDEVLDFVNFLKSKMISSKMDTA
jgi:hypothetical protein